MCLSSCRGQSFLPPERRPGPLAQGCLPLPAKERREATAIEVESLAPNMMEHEGSLPKRQSPSMSNSPALMHHDLRIPWLQIRHLVWILVYPVLYRYEMFKNVRFRTCRSQNKTYIYIIVRIPMLCCNKQLVEPLLTMINYAFWPLR